MRYTSLPFDPDRAPRAGFDYPRGGFGVEQRESLCRGITFFLVLTLSCLLIVYAPLVWDDVDWVAVGVRPIHRVPAAATSTTMSIATPR